MKSYIVTGCTYRELLFSAYDGPPGQKQGSGQYTVGDTTSKQTLRYGFKQEASRCSLSSVAIQLETSIQLPEISTTLGIAPTELEQWNTFLKRLQEHEEGHVAIALKGARSLQAASQQIRPAATCQEVEGSLRTQEDRLAIQTQKAQRDYDDMTQHGRLQP